MPCGGKAIAQMDSDETFDWPNEVNSNAEFDKSAAKAPVLTLAGSLFVAWKRKADARNS
jgi:hypothetical protein